MRFRSLILAAGAVVALAGCEHFARPVSRPCGVIVDNLLGVSATTPHGQQRLDVHHERGVRAGCWGRS